MRWTAVTVLALVGCAEADLADTPTPDSDLELPGRCEADNVQILADHGARPEGYGHSPAEILAEVSGVFLGAVELAGFAADGSLSIDDSVGEVRLVTATWSSSGEPCGSWYELEVTAALSAGPGLLDEVFSVVIDHDPAREATFALEIPVEQLRGTLRPPSSFDAGAREEPVSLVVSGRFDPDAGQRLDPVWVGEMSWRADGADEVWETSVGAFWFR